MKRMLQTNDANTAGDERRTLIRRRVVSLLSLGVVLAIFIWLTVFISRNILQYVDSPEKFKEYIDSYGWQGRFILLGLQFLQVVIAFIPGELIEVGAGYAFGAVEGTLLCMGGAAVASCFVFLLTRLFGIRLVETFISRDKINELRFINSEQKLKRMIFILFFIPGTPKDVLTYFAGLTRIRLHEFLIITTIARIPSIVSSTIGGDVISNQNYGLAILIFAVTGVVSLLGMKVYSVILGRKKDKGETAEPADASAGALPRSSH
ncbi:MAG: TVP38/TMEM64 family protein [Clostridiales bacterium]|nr:TVP38/TMEM64 family protein [Clostridiales bacterium]